VTRITITSEDHGIGTALERIIETGKSPRPLMMAIGETLVASTKRRFATSTDPEGKPWAPNSPVTISRYLNGTKGNFKKDGSLSKKGEARVAAKKPLIGETRSLSSNIAWQLAGEDAVVIGSPMIYAGVQQFGAQMGEFGRYSQVARWRKYGNNDFRRHAGTKAGFPIPWGNIPARPFLGVSQSDREAILELAAEYVNT